jgi:uncharacterized protein YcaQ
VTAPPQLSNERARRLAVLGQLLARPRPRKILDVVRGSFFVQMDPTSSVARTEHLVLWSRLGSRYRPTDLERMLWRDKELFEYNAHILPASDYALHRPAMRRWRRGQGSSPTSSARSAAGSEPMRSTWGRCHAPGRAPSGRSEAKSSARGGEPERAEP